MNLYIISDTHNLLHEIDLDSIPKDAILIHAGDAMTGGKHPQEILEFAYLWNSIPNRKYIVPGNHDRHFEKRSSKYWKEYRRIIKGLKVDQAVTIGNTKIWFSPWCRKFRDWSWNKTEDQLVEIYKKIPKDTNILVTHTPPFGTLDVNTHGERCGSEALTLAINNLPELKLVICGHIHESRGYVEKNGILYVNASNCGIPYSDFTKEPYNVIYDEENNAVVDII
jgi:Icc-related predicted phosphoesterase